MIYRKESPIKKIGKKYIKRVVGKRIECSEYG